MFLHINSVNLGLYFNSALISPANYIKSRNDDIQTKNTNNLLLSDKKWSKSTDCSLELVFTNTEITEILKNNISDGYFLFNKPLPLSRVKKVYFRTIEQCKIAVSSANTNAFLPEHLVEIVKIEDVESAIEYNNNHAKSEDLKLNNEIQKYNQFLGGAAFMRLGGENFMNYSPNYFSTFAFFNQLFASEFEKSNNSKIDKMYQGVFDCKDKWKKICPFLYSKKSILYEINEIASQRKLNITKENGIYNLNEISDDYIYILAILEDFAHSGKRRNTDGLVSLISQSEIKKAEGITLLYGLYNGYAGFRNKYVLRNGEEIKTVKFRLDSQIDYYTIESIYQYVFNNVTNNNFFQYLDSWILKQEYREIEGFETYKILDKQVIYTKKKTKFGEPGYFEDVILNYFDNNAISNSLATEISKWFNFPISIPKKDIEITIHNLVAPILKHELNRFYNQIVKDGEQIKSFVGNNEIDQIEQEYILEQQRLEEEIRQLNNENKRLREDISNQHNSKSAKGQNEYSSEQLNLKSIDELVIIAHEKGIKVPKKTKRETIITNILNAQKTLFGND